MNEEAVTRFVMRLRYLAGECPDISNRLYDEAQRIEALQEVDNRTKDELAFLRDSCLDIAERIRKLLREAVLET